jgi:hypothetical protein
MAKAALVDAAFAKTLKRPLFAAYNVGESAL